MSPGAALPHDLKTVGGDGVARRQRRRERRAALDEDVEEQIRTPAVPDPPPVRRARPGAADRRSRLPGRRSSLASADSCVRTCRSICREPGVGRGEMRRRWRVRHIFGPDADRLPIEGREPACARRQAAESWHREMRTAPFSLRPRPRMSPTTHPGTIAVTYAGAMEMRTGPRNDRSVSAVGPPCHAGRADGAPRQARHRRVRAGVAPRAMDVPESCRRAWARRDSCGRATNQARGRSRRRPRRRRIMIVTRRTTRGTARMACGP